MQVQERGSLSPVIFESAEDILNWQPSNISPLMVSSVPVAPRIRNGNLRFLAGLDNGQWSYSPEFDRNPQGGPSGNVYNFPYWQYVDDIYYYMHALAAVPPVVWTNAAHRNGVRMFAAVTADFDGQNGGVEFNKLFENPDAAASQLFKIVNTYCFDGWMFDVENGAVAGSNLLKAMTLLRAMRLWNGAQVEVGFYQGGSPAMTPDIVPFFKAGSFFQSDYSYKSDPANYPKETYDLLVKNGLAGARFNTYWSVYTNNFSSPDSGSFSNGCAYLDLKGFFDRLALAKMTPPSSDVYQSLSIFAPDWTMYGGVAENKKCQLPARDLFQRTERLFWVGSAIGTDGKPVTSSPCVADYMSPRSAIVSPPFVTRFNTGQGSFFNAFGRRVASRSWNYLSGQDLLPTWIAQTGTPNAGVIADIVYDDAYDGGSALAFKGTLAAGSRVEYSLYLAKIPLAHPANVLLRYKRGASALLPYLKVSYSNGTSEVLAAPAAPDWQRNLLRLSPPADGVLTEICAGFFNSSPTAAAVDILLGELGVLWAGSQPPADIIPVTPNQDNLLIWKQPGGFFTPWYYNVYGMTAQGPAFVGRTILTTYDLNTALFQIGPVIGNQYRIQPVDVLGQAAVVQTE